MTHSIAVVKRRVVGVICSIRHCNTGLVVANAVTSVRNPRVASGDAALKTVRHKGRQIVVQVSNTTLDVVYNIVPVRVHIVGVVCNLVEEKSERSTIVGRVLPTYRAGCHRLVRCISRCCGC